jgi:hypothetical protein
MWPLNRFLEEELMEWHAFDQVITSTTDFDFGKESVMQLIARYSTLIPNYEESVAIKICDGTVISDLWLL